MIMASLWKSCCFDDYHVTRRCGTIKKIDLMHKLIVLQNTSIVCYRYTCQCVSIILGDTRVHNEFVYAKHLQTPFFFFNETILYH